MTMDTVLKNKWIKELRSGRYPQTRYALHRLKANDEAPVGYCCLGVLATVAGFPEKVDEHDDSITEFGMYGAGHQFYFNSVTIGYSQAFELGIARAGTRNALVDMNDSGKSFSEIADWVEENL